MDRTFEWFWRLETSGWGPEGEEKKELTEGRRGPRRCWSFEWAHSQGRRVGHPAEV